MPFCEKTKFGAQRFPLIQPSQTIIQRTVASRFAPLKIATIQGALVRAHDRTLNETHTQQQQKKKK